MKGSNLFLGGVPTKPDVDKLRKAFGVPAEGTVIKHEEVEALLGYPRTSCRFKTVLESWRRSLDREHNVIFGPQRGIGIVVLPPNERIELSAHKIRVGGRIIGRAGRIAVTTDQTRLTPDNRRASEHVQRTVASIRLAVVTSAKQIDMPSPEKSR